MERTEMERSANTDPGSRCLPGPETMARVGVAMVFVAVKMLATLLEAKEAEAD
jgi:hypothetical protein